MGIADKMQRSVAEKLFSGFGIDPAAIMAQIHSFVLEAQALNARLERLERQNAEMLTLLRDMNSSAGSAHLVSFNKEYVDE